MTGRWRVGVLILACLGTHGMAGSTVLAAQDGQTAGAPPADARATVVPRAATHVATNETIEGNLCVGSASCSAAYEPSDDVEIVAFPPSLVLATCTPPSDLCSSWWQLLVDEDWIVRDKTAGTIPVRVEKGAPDNAVHVGSNGQIGVGVVPSEDLDVATASPLVRLEETGLAGGASAFASLGLDAGLLSLFGPTTLSVANSLHVSAGGVAVGVSSLNSKARTGLTVYSPGAESTDVRIQDGSAGASAWGDLQLSVGPPGETGYFEIEGPTGNSLVRAQTDGPTGLVLDAAGSVGVGTAAPTAVLTVQRSDGNSQVLIQDLSPTVASRTLLKLENDGFPRLVLQDSSLGTQWVAASVGGGGFTFNRVGSGLVEMKLYPGGDMTIGGMLTEGSSRKIKRDIVPVDVDRVLEAVRGLPIVRWTYRTSERGLRHLGPLAEDFHRALGVGAAHGIAPIDGAGVALSAIQGLDRSLENRLAAQRGEVKAIARDIESQEERLGALEELLGADPD